MTLMKPLIFSKLSIRMIYGIINATSRLEFLGDGDAVSQQLPLGENLTVAKPLNAVQNMTLLAGRRINIDTISIARREERALGIS